MAANLDPSAPAPSTAERVILVDRDDREVGIAEKLEAHRDGGRLHRAFSVFLFDERGRMLIQQRAAPKYHFPLLWSNACCGHPRPGESVVDAARRRVAEELGADVAIEPVFAFLYEADDAATGLCERELDHALVGRLSAEPVPCPVEIEAIAWCETSSLERDVAAHPKRYTPWFRLALVELARRGALPAPAA